MKTVIHKPKFADYQREYLYTKHRFTIVEACTKSGKTYSHIYWFWETSLGYEDGVKKYEWKKGAEFWWVAPVYSQAEIAFNRLVRKVANVHGYKINFARLAIMTPIGTVMRFKSAGNSENLYGEDVYAAVFDEFTRAKEEAWFALRSTLTHTKGKCKFIGNYTGDSSWGHILSKKAMTDPEYAYFKIDCWLAIEQGIMDMKEVLQAKEDLPTHVFKALYQAEGEVNESRLFSAESIEDVWTNSPIRDEQGVIVGKTYMSCDIAMQGSDSFVIGVWIGLHLKSIIRIDKSDGKEVEQKIREIAAKHSVPFSRIVYDADGLGSYLKGYLKSSIPFHNGGKTIEVEGQKLNYSNLKSQCTYKLSEMIDKVSIEDDRYRKMISQELEVIRKVNKNDGKYAVTAKDEIKTLIGRSPDFSDMLMMRMRFELDTFTGEYIFA